MISIVVLTHNEAINIERCLHSVSWSDDILVVDSGSSDGTQALAERLGARVIFRAFDDFAGQRNHALAHGGLKHPFVLHLDADEVVTDELRDQMHRVAASGDSLKGYRVPFRLMMMGQWLRYSGMYPTYQVRFGRRDSLRFHMVGHGQREMLDFTEVGTLTGDLIHHNFSKGISDWLAKHARYARAEAAEVAKASGSRTWSEFVCARDPVERRRILKNLAARMPLRPLARFGYMYFLRRGFLDGKAGFRYAMLVAAYQWFIDMNVEELRRGGKGN